MDKKSLITQDDLLPEDVDISSEQRKKIHEQYKNMILMERIKEAKARKKMKYYRNLGIILFIWFFVLFIGISWIIYR